MKPSSSIVLAVVAAACLARVATAQTWTVETVGSPAYVHDVAIDGSGTLHVLYADLFSSPTPSLVYTVNSGGGWQSEVVPAVPIPNLIALVTDGAGIPHITFVDTSGSVQYGHRTGAPWVIEPLPPPTDVPYNPEIALDANGDPHIAFVTYGDRIRHVFKSGGVWTDEEVTGSFLSASFSRAAIAVGNDGNVRIASRDQFAGVAYFTRSGGFWTAEYFGQWGQMTGLALDDNDHAHIVYTGDGVYYATNKTGSWNVETLDSSILNDCGITLDATGEPCIAYTDTKAIRYQNPDLYYHTDVYFAYRVGGGWQREVVDSAHDYAGDYAWRSRVAIDGSGVPHVVYRDASTGEVKHATRNWPTTAGDDTRPATFGIVSVAPNPFNPETRITFQLPVRSSVQVSAYDVRGRRVRLLADRSFGPGLHSEVWDGRDDGGVPVASGVYFIRVKTPTRSDVRRVVQLK